MKTRLNTILRRALSLIIVMAATLPTSAYDFMVDGLAYNINEDGTSVTVTYDYYNYPTYSGDISVPEMVTYNDENYTVTAIGEHSFYQCRDLVSIELPNTITEIGNGAFGYCSGLTAIIVPNSVTDIGQLAFQNCTSMESITLPDSLKDLSNYVLMNCTSLQSITLPNGLKNIHTCAFDGCSGLTGIVIPNSVERINSFAFRDCSSLEVITLGESLNYIDKEAFTSSCSKLNAVKWDVIDYEDFNSRDENPFYLLNLLHGNITSFEFGDNVIHIPSYICSQFTNLEAIHLPQSVKRIGDEAFVSCSSITSLHIPQGVETIGDYAFAACEAITSIVSDILSPESVACSTDAFSMIDNTSCTLYIPQGTLASYQSTAPWNDFLNIVEKGKADVDMDGAVTCADVTAIYNYLLGNEYSEKATYDVNGDGTITSADVTAIYNSLLEGDNTGDSNITTYTVNGVSFNMIKVKGGTFMMGCDEDDEEATDYDRPAHQVTLSDYSMGQTEVTQELWIAVMGINSMSVFQGDKHPVESVSHYQCEQFVDKLNELTGLSFRLPTEAEWEYAACGGSKSKGYKYSGSDNLEAVAWYYGNSYFQDDTNPDFGTHIVGLKEPNELGLYDMSGNVYEWCADFANHYKPEPQTDPVGDEYSNSFIMRGGSWDSTSTNCRVKIRNSQSNTGSWLIGLRLAL